MALSTGREHSFCVRVCCTLMCLIYKRKRCRVATPCGECFCVMLCRVALCACPCVCVCVLVCVGVRACVGASLSHSLFLSLPSSLLRHFALGCSRGYACVCIYMGILIRTSALCADVLVRLQSNDVRDGGKNAMICARERHLPPHTTRTFSSPPFTPPTHSPPSPATLHRNTWLPG